MKFDHKLAIGDMEKMNVFYMCLMSSLFVGLSGGAGGGKYLWQVPSPGECEQQRLSCEVEVWRSKYEELKQTYVIRDHSLLAKSGLLIVGESVTSLRFILPCAYMTHASTYKIQAEYSLSRNSKGIGTWPYDMARRSPSLRSCI